MFDIWKVPSKRYITMSSGVGFPQTNAKLKGKAILRYFGVLHAKGIGILFAWESHIFPYLFYQGYHVAYKTFKIGKICACLVPLT